MTRATGGSSAAAPKFFRDSDTLRAWLRANHASRSELWVGLHKKGSGTPSITWPQLVDQLLCFGWIDGVRKSLGDDSYTIRVTPRRPGSIWSAVNVRRAAELMELGLMDPAGQAVYDARDEAKTNRYSFERDQVAFSAEYEAEFRKNRKAWSFFSAQPPSYRKTITWWVMSAKREVTQRKRLDVLIRDSASGVRVGLLK
jgi:uncharacterized protein YdeI (YjbR/CyaY-like superfamily)